MITLTRRTALALGTVLRRDALGLPRRGTVPPLAFRAGPDAALRVRHRQGRLAVEFLAPAPPRPRETVLLPLDALAELGAAEDSAVVLETLNKREAEARFDVGDCRQARRVEVPRRRSLPPFPVPAAALHAAPAGLLAGLADLSRSARVIRLRGGLSRLEDEEGWRSPLAVGPRLPWPDDVAVAASPVFARRALRAESVLVGRTATHVVLRCGPWTLWLAAVPATSTAESETPSAGGEKGTEGE